MAVSVDFQVLKGQGGLCTSPCYCPAGSMGDTNHSEEVYCDSCRATTRQWLPARMAPHLWRPQITSRQPQRWVLPQLRTHSNHVLSSVASGPSWQRTQPCSCCGFQQHHVGQKLHCFCRRRRRRSTTSWTCWTLAAMTSSRPRRRPPQPQQASPLLHVLLQLPAAF